MSERRRAGAARPAAEQQEGTGDDVRSGAPRRVGLGITLVVVWVLLADTVTPGQVLAGVAVAGVVLVVLRGARPSGERWRVRPLAVVHLAVWFGWQFLVSNFHVARAVLWPGRWVRTGVVRVPLTTSSPTLVALVANITALTPGMQPVSATTGVPALYIHVLSLTTGEEVSAVVQRLERLVVAAFGPAGEEGR